MMIFEITDDKHATFNLEAKQLEILNLTRTDVAGIFRYVYDNPKMFDFNDAISKLEKLLNPVEQEIAKQILNKLREFDENSEIIKKELDEKFPGLG